MADDAAPSGQAPGAGTSPEGSTVLAFVADEHSEVALRGGLTEATAIMVVRRGDIHTAIRVLQNAPSPRALIVDVSHLEDPVEALEELARVCTPETDVMVVGERSDIAFYRDIVRDFGVSEYLHKPLTRDSVAQLFGPVIAGLSTDTDQRRGGRIVAVCGVRGGAGATTLAANLAFDLAEKTRGHVALLDLHLRGGTAALLLGLNPSAGLKLALENPERTDALFLERVAIPVGERLRVIATEEPIDSDPNPSHEGVERLLDILRQRFNQIVVDMPMPPQKAEWHVLARARYRILVVPPDLAGVRDAVAMRQALANMHGGTTVTVLNRAGEPGAMDARMMREGLGNPPDFVIPDLRQPLSQAANMGELAVQSSSAYRRALAPLTQEISGIAVSRRKGLFARFLRR